MRLLHGRCAPGAVGGVNPGGRDGPILSLGWVDGSIGWLRAGLINNIQDLGGFTTVFLDQESFGRISVTMPKTLNVVNPWLMIDKWLIGDSH